MKLTFTTADTAPILSDLKTANIGYQHIYIGDSANRQPVHTVYGGANLFTHDTAARFSAASLKSLRTYAPNFAVLARVIGLEGGGNLPTDTMKIALLAQQLADMSDAERRQHPAWLAYTVYNRVIEKLKNEALEDFRIDFEDGFGNRSDEEEDATAVQAALEVAKGMAQNSLPPFIGIRIKPFNEDTKVRGIRTLDIF